MYCFGINLIFTSVIIFAGMVPPHCGKTGIGSRAHLRQAPSAQQYRSGTCVRLKTLITSACLKHPDFLIIDNWIEMCLTAVHMKPFSMKERVRRLGSTNSCPTADAK